MGPSPQVRGTALRHRRALRQRGTIPAGAGNSSVVYLNSASYRDHPRRCGEQRMERQSAEGRIGPSPQVRGTGAGPSWPCSPRGTIPAGAGNRCPTVRDGILPGDHPRRCGEQVHDARSCSKPPGPSPQVRGTVCPSFRWFLRSRTIPAGAGNSRRSHQCPTSRRDHPRRCGEQSFRIRSHGGERGPSPQVRGTVRGGFHVAARQRTIPAGAGNRFMAKMGILDAGDHPRRCGEQQTLHLVRAVGQGPSPQVRGTEVDECRTLA